MELIVVIAILAILAGVAISVYSGYISKAEDAVALEEAYNAHMQYWAENLPDEGSPDCFIFVAEADRIAAIKNGRVLPEIYTTEQAAITAAVDDPATEENEAYHYQVSSTSVPKLYALVQQEGNAWEGATAVFVGDSITAGSGTTKTYFQFLKETLDFASVTGMGLGGSCISAKSDYGTGIQPLINRYSSIPDADLIVVFMGTNDYGHETPMGTMADTTDVSFYGALNVIIPGILGQHPNSQLVFVTPLHRYGFGKSKILGTNFTYDHIPNGRGYGLGDYVAAIKAVCATYSVPVIDLYNACPINPENTADREAYFPDGLHPNAAGHAIVAETMAAQLQRYANKNADSSGGQPSGPQTPDIQPPATQPPATDAPDEPQQGDFQYGNKFAAGFDNKGRLSAIDNLYLTAGQTVTLKDPDKYVWSLAQTASINSTNNQGYYPSSGGWTSNPVCVIPKDGYYGLVLKKADETDFDLAIEANNIYDYISIE